VAVQARHRAPARRLGRWLVPCALTALLWLADDTPFGAEGFALFAALGASVSVCYPLLALMAAEAPGAVVPWQWRAWYRRGRPRPSISARLRRIVYAADRHRCCYCNSSVTPQLDHVRPWSLGGRSSVFNLMTLCGPCNRVKSNYWAFRGGRHAYNPFAGHGNIAEAAKILAFERRHRWSLLRFARAALAL
jgi:5-methylcytosine-specific restriction endonuclease McrA